MQPITTLWNEHKTRLRSYISKRVRQSDAVDDILQEVFLKAYTNIHTIKSVGSITAWLYRITANEIIDYYREQKVWQLIEELPTDLAQPKRERDYIMELAMSIQPFIAMLPATYREALTMAEIDGLPQAEIAKRLSISLSGAKSRIQRGREKLRGLFLECCDIEHGANGLVGYAPREGGCACEYTHAEILRLLDAITVYQSTAQ
ncbi:MAG: RNA polymerase sigma factor SigZ [Burkholderiaceae bacterium]